MATKNIKNKKKICVITGSRAEYGLLKNLIVLLKNSKELDSKLLVTGSHLERRYGLTEKEIISDGIKIDLRAKIHGALDEDLSMKVSTAIKVLSKSLNKLKPDFVVLLGDRYEIFAAASAAFLLRIPIIHIHGGETTFGSMDESFRHAITKLSYLHFAATKDYKRRLEQLGENPKRVFNVGGLGVDYIKNISLLKKHVLEENLGIRFNKKNILITIHPDTTEEGAAKKLTVNLLKVLSSLKDTNLFFSESNADPGGVVITDLIKIFINQDNKTRLLFNSLGIKKYLSLVQQMDIVVGNSSSGILEVPSLKIPTLNIGDRQNGRLKSSSVIDCKSDFLSIEKKITMLLNKKSSMNINYKDNPYGRGGASKRILSIIEKLEIPKNLKKPFFDIKQIK